MRLKARAPDQYFLWSYCSGALAFNRKFLPEGLRGAALAAEIFLLLSLPLPPSRFPGAGMHTQADLLICSKGHEHAT